MDCASNWCCHSGAQNGSSISRAALRAVCPPTSFFFSPDVPLAQSEVKLFGELNSPFKSHPCSWHLHPSCDVTCWCPVPRSPDDGDQPLWCWERVKKSHAMFTLSATWVSFCRAIWPAAALSQWQDVVNCVCWTWHQKPWKLTAEIKSKLAQRWHLLAWLELFKWTYSALLIDVCFRFGFPQELLGIVQLLLKTPGKNILRAFWSFYLLIKMWEGNTATGRVLVQATAVILKKTNPTVSKWSY